MIAKGSDAQARTALAACAARLNRTPTASSRVDFIHVMSLTESFPASLTPLVSSDVETIDFVKSVIDGREGEKVAHALEGGLRLVGKELGERVSDKYETLLANVNATHAIEGKLLRSNERVEALAQAVQRIEGQIAKPFNQLGESLEQYERMLESAELLRQVQRAVTQVKRLRDAMSPPVRTAAAASSAASPAPKPSPAAARRVDLPKAATAMHELETIFAAADLSGVSVIDTELAFIRESGVSIRSQATTMLQSGLSEQSPAQMGAALQVFFNLHELPEAAIHAATEVASGLKAAVASAFDASVFGVDAAIKAAGGGGVLGDLGATSQSKNGMPPSSVHGSWKQTLWTRAEGVGEALYVAALRLADLQKVIVKKRDPLTHVLFAALIEQTTKSAGGAAKEEEEETAVSSSSAAANDRWGCADPSILASSLMLTSIVTDLNWASPTATAAAVAAPSKEASSAAASPPLFALWAPLCTALNASIESAMASAPFVRSCLSTEPSRLLTILMAAAERFEAQLSPAPVSDEAYYALNPEALTRNLGGAVDLYRRDLIGSLNAACEGSLAAVVAAAASSEGVAAAERGRLGASISSELKKAGEVPPLAAICVSACAQSVNLFANRCESMIEVGEGEKPLLINGELLNAVQSLRADVHAALDKYVDARIGTPLRAALGTPLVPVLTLLANPGTPLPESLRERATNMLKSLLRSGDIHDDE